MLSVTAFGGIFSAIFVHAEEAGAVARRVTVPRQNLPRRKPIKASSSSSLKKIPQPGELNDLLG
jgi:hypothetical protein